MLSPQKKEEVRQMIEVVMMKNLPLDNSFEWREEVANLIVEKFDQLSDEELSSHTQEIRDSVMKLKNSKIIGIVGATKRNANFKNDGWHDALKKVLQILESNE